MSAKSDCWQLGPEALKFIQYNLAKGATILELGSGKGTAVLAQRYHMHSIEHDPTYLGLHDSNYIYAPLRAGWYCSHMLYGRIPNYDLLLVDGPPSGAGPYGRAQMIAHIKLFDLTKPVIIDDVNRVNELLLATTISANYDSMTIHDEADGRKFAYVTNS